MRDNTTLDRIVIRQPDDWHVHLRDGLALQTALGLPVEPAGPQQAVADHEAHAGQHAEG